MHSLKIKLITVLLIATVATLLTILIVIENPARHEQTAMNPSNGNSVPSKQLWHCKMNHPEVIQDHPGDCPICHMPMTPMNADESASDGKKTILYWWDPMLGPSSISNHPGKSAMGMEMVPVYADSAGPTVTIDPVLQQNMGVRTAIVTRGPLNKTVRTVGLLKIPEPGMHEVSLKVAGWVDKLYADQEGMHISAGEPLFGLYSPDLEVAAGELIAATKSRKALSADAGENLQLEAQSLVDSSKRKLRQWGVADEEIDAIAKADRPPIDITFRSPATGHIEEKMIVQGSAVQPGMKLMRIADHSKIWLEAQVYQGQIPIVKMGQEVMATVDGMPDRTFKGKITFMYPHVDHMTRTLMVRMTLDNPRFELKPGMYATADMMTQPMPDAIQVPREAVIDTGARQIAFVDSGNGHFEPRKVHMGMPGDDDKVQILDGLAPGETVVTSGQFLMDVESRTIEATQKLTEQPAATQPATEAMPTAATQPVEGGKGLVVVHCVMVKADWLQQGDAIVNPYMGTEMLTCGDVTRKVAAPPEGSPSARVLTAYLQVNKNLAADKLDASAVDSLKASVDALPPGKAGVFRMP